MQPEKLTATGAAAINSVFQASGGVACHLLSVAIKFSAAPTTSESLSLTLVSDIGSTYDVLLYSLNPSLASITDVYWMPDGSEPVVLMPGTSLKVAYTNTDVRTYGITVIVQAVEG